MHITQKWFSPEEHEPNTRQISYMPLFCEKEQVNQIYSVEKVMQTLKRPWVEQTIVKDSKTFQ